MRVLTLWVRGRSGDGCELDGVAELLELCDEVSAASIGLVFAGEVVGTEFVVDGVVSKDVPADDQQGVSNGDQGALLTASFADALEPHREVAVLGADRCPCCLDERGREIGVPGSGAGWFVLAG